MKYRVLTVLTLASIILSACTAQPITAPIPAPTATSAPFCDRREVESTIQRFDNFLSYYANICENVDVNDRDSLEHSMSEVTLMKGQLNLLGVPPCLNESKNYLISAMDALYDGLWNTKMDSAQWYIDEKLATGEIMLKEYTNALMKAKLFISD